MTALANNYWIFFVAAAVAYVVFYLVPLLRALGTLTPEGLDRLTKQLDEDVATVTAEGRPGRRGKPVADVSTKTDSVWASDDDVRLDDSPIGPDADAPSDDDWAEEEEEEEVVSGQRWATERLNRLDSLQGDYQGIVKEAVDQVHSQYPDGAYQRFEIERLPAVASFAERVGAARSMAGLFVLLGLLFTMIRLNGVVQEIAQAARGQTLEPEAFLERMGSLMGGIGGAFDSSIYGLMGLVGALVVVGAVDWVAQNRVLRVEQTIVGTVIPKLATLSDRLKPNLTLADLLADTGAHLEELSGTVGSLTGELDVSLSKLGDRIGRMMDDFRSFQDQYARLDDLLKHMRQAAQGLDRTAAKLENAAEGVNAPLSKFNQTLLTHVTSVVEWVDVSRAGFETLSNEMAAVREHSDRLVEGLARAAEDGFGESLKAHQQAIGSVERQATSIERRLEAMIEALDRAAAALPSGDGSLPLTGESP